MYPELFRIPGLGLSIYSYGLMMVIGFFGAVQLAKFLAHRNRLDPELFINAALLALISGVIGARASHVLENLSDFTRHDRTAWQNFLAMINVRSGGLTYYGGFLLAFPTLVCYALWKKIPLRLGMDIVAPCIMVGLGFGRIGCFLNGCCYGAECNLPWAVSFPYGSNAYVDQYYNHEIQPPAQLLRNDELMRTPDGPVPALVSAQDAKKDPAMRKLVDLYQLKAKPVQPAELYSSFTAFLLAALLVAYLTMPHMPGRVFALMCMLEGISRFLLEMVRVEPPVIGRFSLSMVIGLAVMLIGVILWFAFGRPDPREKLAVAAA